MWKAGGKKEGSSVHSLTECFQFTVNFIIHMSLTVQEEMGKGQKIGRRKGSKQKEKGKEKKKERGKRGKCSGNLFASS